MDTSRGALLTIWYLCSTRLVFCISSVVVMGRGVLPVFLFRPLFPRSAYSIYIYSTAQYIQYVECEKVAYLFWIMVKIYAWSPSPILLKPLTQTLSLYSFSLSPDLFSELFANLEFSTLINFYTVIATCK